MLVRSGTQIFLDATVPVTFCHIESPFIHILGIGQIHCRLQFQEFKVFRTGVIATLDASTIGQETIVGEGMMHDDQGIPVMPLLDDFTRCQRRIRTGHLVIDHQEAPVSPSRRNFDVGNERPFVLIGQFPHRLDVTDVVVIEYEIQVQAGCQLCGKEFRDSRRAIAMVGMLVIVIAIPARLFRMNELRNDELMLNCLAAFDKGLEFNRFRCIIGSMICRKGEFIFRCRYVKIRFVCRRVCKIYRAS